MEANEPKSEHVWDKGEIIGYENALPSLSRYILPKPIMRYTCSVCGEVVVGNGGSGYLIYCLLEESCKGPDKVNK